MLCWWQAARRDRQAKIDSGRSSTDPQTSMQYLAAGRGHRRFAARCQVTDTAKLHVEHTTMPPPPPQMGGLSMA